MSEVKPSELLYSYIGTWWDKAEFELVTNSKVLYFFLNFFEVEQKVYFCHEKGDKNISFEYDNKEKCIRC